LLHPINVGCKTGEEWTSHAELNCTVPKSFDNIQDLNETTTYKPTTSNYDYGSGSGNSGSGDDGSGNSGDGSGSNWPLKKACQCKNGLYRKSDGNCVTAENCKPDNISIVCSSSSAKS
jgi:hypothetical protein